MLSFITQQTGRGVQIESPIATFWMWDAFRGRIGGSSLYYDSAILTYQLQRAGHRDRRRRHDAAARARGRRAARARRRRHPPRDRGRRGASAARSRDHDGPHPLQQGRLAAVRRLARGADRVRARRGRISRTDRRSWCRHSSGSASPPSPSSSTRTSTVSLLSLKVDMLVALTVRNLLYIPLLVWAIWALCAPARPATDSRARMTALISGAHPARAARARPRRLRHRHDRVRGDGPAAEHRRGPAPRAVGGRLPRRPSPRPAR